MWMFEDALFSSPAVTLRDNIIPVWYFSSLERIQGGAILEEGNSAIPDWVFYTIALFLRSQQDFHLGEGERTMTVWLLFQNIVSMWCFNFTESFKPQ